MKFATIAFALLTTAPALAAQRSAVISLDGCQSVGAPVLMWAVFADSYLDDSVAALGWHAGMLLCDADLPSDATRFDYAELEYLPGTSAGPPWMVAYAIRRMTSPGGARSLTVDEIGSCGGLDPAAYPPWGFVAWNFPLSICQTPGWVDLPGSGKEATGVMFLVVIPVDHYASTDSEPDFLLAPYFNQVYRIVEYYEQ